MDFLSISDTRLKDWLNAGHDVNRRDACGMTLLHLAVHIGDSRAVGQILAAGGDVSRTDLTGETVLSRATRLGKHAVMKQLLEAGADPNVTAMGSSPPLLSAARRGDEAGVEILLAGEADPNFCRRGNESPLHGAADAASSPILSTLIEAGADVSIADRFDQTALHVATARSEDGAAVRLLLEAGADPNARDIDGNTPLMLSKLSLETMRLLLGAGTDVSCATFSDGKTALHQASRLPPALAAEGVALLLAAGADPEAEDVEGNKPLYYFRRDELPEATAALQAAMDSGLPEPSA